MSKWIDADATRDLLIRNISLTNGIDTALKEAPSIKTKEVKYFDEDEKVWKIGHVIDEGERSE